MLVAGHRVAHDLSFVNTWADRLTLALLISLHFRREVGCVLLCAFGVIMNPTTIHSNAMKMR